MPLQSPVIRDLSLWNSRVSNSVWEIYTPDKNSLYWSILISYLIPSVHSKNPVDFAKRLKNLKDDSLESQSLMGKLENFNPFKKKHAFHFGDNMAVVMQKFKKRINQRTNFRPSGVNVDDLKLAAASEMLNCFIEVYRLDSTGIQKKETFSPRAQSIVSSSNLSTIIIFYHPETQLKNRVKDTFGFGMVFEIAQPLREKALTFILRKDNFLKENNIKIQQVVRNSENFLISLLKSDVKDAILRIYKSPYILAKLQNAGYNTNPLVKGNEGLSAFYFSMQLMDTQYLNILYSYVSNNFFKPGESCRKPNEEILKKLSDLKCAFETDFGNSTAFSLLPPFVVQRYTEILKFNKYQTKVAKIMKDNQQNNIEDTILAIFKEYTDYFLYPSDAHNEFENYLKFSYYYESLDSYTCLLLFDSLLLVKRKAYSDLVEPLFLMMMSNNYFPQKLHNHDSGTLLGCKGCAHRAIPFKYRTNFFKVLKKVLNKIETGPEGAIASPVDMILRSIQSIPKDEFLLERLKTSLKTAINVEVNDTKNVLTIFRTLQVLGEVIATSTNENFVSGFLLSAHIPYDLELALMDIRNDISHYKANVIQGRLNLETRIGLFQKIQDELKLIYQTLEPVFSCQQFKMKEYIIQSASPLFYVSNEELKNIAVDRETWSKTNRDQFKSYTVNVFRLFERVLKKSFPKMNDPKKYFQRIKRLQDGAKALNFVFSFKVKFVDPMTIQHLIDAGDELQNIITSLEKSEPTDQDIAKLQGNFLKYKSLLKQVFNLDVNDANSELKCENLIHLKENLRDFNVFEKAENLKIRKIILDFLEPSFQATMKLETALRNSQTLPDLDQVLDQTYLPNKKRKKIKVTFLSEPTQNLKILEDFSYNSKDKALGKEHETTQKLVEMLAKEEYKKVLLQLSSTFEKSLENKFLKLVNQKIEFLIKKINLIENILIDEEDDIRDLVKWGRSDEIKDYNKFLMRQRYVMELDVKSSLEMLLFDCMNIMDKRKDLVDIYTKMDNMFAGVDLRNILSHGNILIDTLGTLLDPDDLPSEIIIKMLELIDDKKALKALSDLWIKKKPMTTEELERLIKNQNECQNPNDVINCPRWKSYAVFLPTRQ
ncbi:hypothetical protein HNY73_017935 [Argiope bruennichi]|uniref:Uncharacterized protein n=1 Tax=Argiope bruennichi TaxID=94029 RepID=A0A8T0ECD1_ARGBR|nr:hypothetical protein HNY73_017935 [Argiope bruennichi]